MGKDYKDKKMSPKQIQFFQINRINDIASDTPGETSDSSFQAYRFNFKQALHVLEDINWMFLDSNTGDNEKTYEEFREEMVEDYEDADSHKDKMKILHKWYRGIMERMYKKNLYWKGSTTFRVSRKGTNEEKEGG